MGPYEAQDCEPQTHPGQHTLLPGPLCGLGGVLAGPGRHPTTDSELPRPPAASLHRERVRCTHTEAVCSLLVTEQWRGHLFVWGL